LHRQWDYIFGLRQDAAYLDVPKVKTEARIVMAPPMGDHPLMSKLLLDHAKELSTDPAKEVVILVGHGPTRAEDNAADMAIMNTHARRLAAAGKFSSVKAVNLQDDAPAPVREANVKLLRGWVADAAKSGRTPIIVGFLMSTRGIQGKIVEDLEGLPYKFQSKGITAHPNFTEWLRAIVAEQVKEL
jgi:sirohydrochlorin ferrochelatase